MEQASFFVAFFVALLPSQTQSATSRSFSGTPPTSAARASAMPSLSSSASRSRCSPKGPGIWRSPSSRLISPGRRRR